MTNRRPRILVVYVDSPGQRAFRFELEESVWAEPVPPEPLTDEDPRSDLGAPSTFRLAGESDHDNIYTIGLAEHSDGGGRSLTIQLSSHDSSTPQQTPHP